MQKQNLVFALSHIKFIFAYSTSQVVTVNCCCMLLNHTQQSRRQLSRLLSSPFVSTASARDDGCHGDRCHEGRQCLWLQDGASPVWCHMSGGPSLSATAGEMEPEGNRLMSQEIDRTVKQSLQPLTPAMPIGLAREKVLVTMVTTDIYTQLVKDALCSVSGT